MIDPLIQLSFNLHANRGVYALLLGSGVSRAAGIPTGWEVIVELARRLANLYGEDPSPDPTEWYRQRFHEEPSYTGLLDGLAGSPAERQQILRGYFEPDAEEQERGLKGPTKAHRGIADLVAAGHVRVILTTNFDRLLETALADAGVVPTVIATPDAVDGAVPLVHSSCCVVKLHGDYLDTRIKNTPSELANYDPRMSRLLDRVLDDFGLLVCGWSGDWDTALRDALTRAPNRRYTTYWAVKGEPTGAARDLIALRQAVPIQISDAESFFVSVQEKLHALDDLNQPHPLSAAIAIATAKRYLAEDRYNIRLHDLVLQEVDRALEALPTAPHERDGLLGPALTKAAQSVESAMSIVLPLLAHGVYWGGTRHEPLWVKSLDRLLNHQLDARAQWDSLGLLNYPASLALYAMGLAAVESKNLSLLRLLFTVPARRKQTEDKLAISVLPPATLAQKGFLQELRGMERHHAPLNDWMFDVLSGVTTPLLADGGSYQYLFDRFEVLAALSYRSLINESSGWAPLGAFGYREANRERILGEIEESLRISGEESPYRVARLFGSSVAECQKAVLSLRELVTRMGWAWH